MSNEKMNKNDLVWYLSYGSNLNQWRLMKYIEGGKPNNIGHVVHPGKKKIKKNFFNLNNLKRMF